MPPIVPCETNARKQIAVSPIANIGGAEQVQQTWQPLDQSLLYALQKNLNLG